MNFKTYNVKAESIERNWWVIDASQEPLGRLATKIATLLRGKHKPIFTPHLDCGDFVVVVNADKVWVTGKKETNKTYFTHSGYPGGAKIKTFKELKEKHPDRIIRLAVKGMLPHNRLGRRMLKKLKVYAGPEHPHQAQQPAPWKPEMKHEQ